MKTFRNFLYIEFLYNGHLQSLGAISVIILTSIISNIPINFPLIFAIYLIFHTIFLYDRYIDLNKDKTTNSKRTNHILKYKKLIPYILIIESVVSLSILLSLRPLTYTLLYLILFLGLIYPQYVKPLTKVIPLFKNIYVSLVYAILVLLFSINLSWQIIIFSIIVLIEQLSAQFLLDIKDIDSDKQNSLKTLPVLTSAKTTILIYKLISLITVMFCLLLILLNPNNKTLFLLLLSTSVVNILILYLYKNKNVFNALILASSKIFFWISIIKLVTLIK